MRVVFLTFFLFLFTASRGQFQKNSLDSCLGQFDFVSYFWKNDSLGQNGFRLLAVDKMLNCKHDRLTLPFLLSKLGEPNYRVKDRKGTSYNYIYFDGKSLPSAANLAEEKLEIHFYFSDDSPYMKYIGKGHLD